MARSLSALRLLSVSAFMLVLAAPGYAADKAKTAAPAVAAPAPTATPVAVTPAPAPVAAAPAPTKTAEKLPDSYKAGNLEISGAFTEEKGGVYNIYFTVKNNGKGDDALTSAELTDGTGEINTVARVTTKEVTNADAIKKAQAEAEKAATMPPPAPDAKGEKAAAPKPPELPKPEYKDVTKDAEGQPIVLTADKSTKLEAGEAHLKLTGYKAGKNDYMPVMLHFRSAPNVTLKIKSGSKPSFIGKLFGE